MVPQVGKDGKNYKDIVDDKPDTIPFDTGLPTGKPLTYAYRQSACGDNVKADNEVGIDCGLDACGKQCDWGGEQGSVEVDEICDVNEDCSTDLCNADTKTCANGAFSCYDIKRFHPKQSPENGFYEIGIDLNHYEMDVVEVKGDAVVEVYVYVSCFVRTFLYQPLLHCSQTKPPLQKPHPLFYTFKVL